MQVNTESGNAVNKLYLKISHFTSKRKIGNLPCNIRYRGHKQLIIANNTGAFVFHLVFFSMSRLYNIIYKYCCFFRLLYVLANIEQPNLIYYYKHPFESVRSLEHTTVKSFIHNYYTVVKGID